MSANFAGFMACDVKLREPSDRAAARLPDVDEEVEGRSGKGVGELGVEGSADML